MIHQRREAGVLLHPTSLPGPQGIGDLGTAAFAFVDFLAAAGQHLWQVLPLGPTGYGDSPYASFSTFAGNPLLLSLDALVAAGDLPARALTDLPAFDPARVDYGWVQSWKIPLLEQAATNFLASAAADRQAEFAAFCAAESGWLDDFSLFMAVKQALQQQAQAEGRSSGPWFTAWPLDIRLKQPAAVAHWSAQLAQPILVHKVLQFWFFGQWTALRSYAQRQGIRIIGDIPIFVAPDSVDVWAHREFFQLDDQGQPLFVAGVPPDYFSETGQLWGNPLYDWDALRQAGFSWWLDRIQATLKLVDIIRIDHFRGFEAYWRIPAGAVNAVRGQWMKAPGLEFFQVVRDRLGDLPILAEDLGVITAEVDQMRDQLGFPGMKILQFAFETGGQVPTGDNPFLPHNYGSQCVVYSGSHDNDTSRGWFDQAAADAQAYALEYLGTTAADFPWALIRAALASTAIYAILPLQDLLELPASARMNTPSTLGKTGPGGSCPDNWPPAWPNAIEN